MSRIIRRALFHRSRRHGLPVSVLVALGVVIAPDLSAQEPASAPSPRENLAPFNVIANVQYVGSTNVGTFLITTPDGHILIDSGYPKTESWVRGNIERLGFKVSDIKFMLNTHAHADHVGGHAQFKEWTGAKVLIARADAPVLADGGRSDFRSDGRELWRPLTADGFVEEGDVVRLGGVALTAHLTPGHTKGNTTWTMPVEDAGKTYNLVFTGSMGLNARVPLVGNTKYPGIAEDYIRSFEKLRKLRCDIFLPLHADHYNLEGKKKLREAGATPNPFIDPAAYKAYLTKNEALFRAQLEKERSKPEGQ